MIFIGINNQIVELRITNYEFPEITDCEFDSNWLLIYLKVKSDFGNWQTINPSLLNSDVQHIINWFEKIANSEKVASNYLDFLEPNLVFELKKLNSDNKLIRIIFDLESRPQNANDDIEYFVDVEFTNAELRKVATDLKKELKPFPIRAI